jgi:hypothetical protein
MSAPTDPILALALGLAAGDPFFVAHRVAALREALADADAHVRSRAREAVQLMESEESKR